MSNFAVHLLEDADISRQAVSVPEAAKMCGIDPKIMRGHCDAGRLKCFRPSKHRRILVSDLMRFIREREERANWRHRKPVERELD